MTSFSELKIIELKLKESVFLSGHVLTLTPQLAIDLGLAESVIFQQIKFLTSKSKQSKNSVRISYGKLQRVHFPFYTRRWVITLVKRLENAGLLKVTSTGRVNIIEVPQKETEEESYVMDIPDYDESLCGKKKKFTSLNSRMQIHVPLAAKIGLLEALALQQIHLRHKGLDGSKWVVRSFDEWHLHTFMFVGLSTVKRLFAKLENEGLIFVKRLSGESRVVNSYRVNYLRVAEILNIAVPELETPVNKMWMQYEYKKTQWVNPLTPFSPPIC